jgi:hypothetical protein
MYLLLPLHLLPVALLPPVPSAARSASASVAAPPRLLAAAPDRLLLSPLFVIVLLLPLSV